MASPAYNSPENELSSRTNSAATDFTMSLTIASVTSSGSHGTGEYAPMPPVFGPLSPSPTLLKSCAGSSGTTVSPSTTQNSETSGPSRNDSSSTGWPASSSPAACARAASLSFVTTTPLPAARPSSLTTHAASPALGPN